MINYRNGLDGIDGKGIYEAWQEYRRQEPGAVSVTSFVAGYNAALARTHEQNRTNQTGNGSDQAKDSEDQTAN